MSTISTLLHITRDCRADVHEPDEQGLYFDGVIGSKLDNACGDGVDERALMGAYHEVQIVLKRKGEGEVAILNLASLLALARMGAQTELGKKIFG